METIIGVIVGLLGPLLARAFTAWGWIKKDWRVQVLLILIAAVITLIAGYITGETVLTTEGIAEIVFWTFAASKGTYDLIWKNVFNKVDIASEPGAVNK